MIGSQLVVGEMSACDSDLCLCDVVLSVLCVASTVSDVIEEFGVDISNIFSSPM